MAATLDIHADEKPRVLLVEDDADCAEGLACMLANDFNVSIRRTAGSGMASVRVGRPDLILVDYQLPDMDGLAMVDTLRREWGSPVPAIMISAHPKEDDARSQPGIDAFLQKPFERTELLRLIEHLLGMKVG